MKRATYIILIAIVLLPLAAMGWILGLFRKPVAHESSSRRERLAASHELREARRHRVRPVLQGAPLPMPIALTR